MKTVKDLKSCNYKKLLKGLALSLCVILITSINSSASPPGKLIFYKLKKLILPILYPFAKSEWILDKSVGNVDFYYKIADCDGSNTVFLKFNNKNNYAVNITWKEMFITQQVAIKSAGMNGIKELIISPGETAASGCQDLKNERCIIFAKKAIPAYKATITQFEFQDIHVNKIL